MKIIDAHLHFSDIQSFKDTAKDISYIDYSSKGLKKEFDDNNIIMGIGMGLTEESMGGFPDNNSQNPMGLDLEESIPKFLVYSVGINPIKLSENKNKELIRIERELEKDNVVGIKIYAGYYPYYIYDEVYENVYDLAKKYNMPVTIHSGDTYSQRGLLKYSHPLTVDELAVSHRDINFTIAHFGDPWIMDTAEVIAKNPNVYADLSGLIVGDKEKVDRFKNQRLYLEHIQRGLIYADNYFKILFGSDWPLVQIEPYIDFVKELVPKEFYEYVFYRNALKVFPKINKLL
ncbi:amidohydrolase family protein [Dethiothermospora halolimnae]|uniref:amidohydrolase family protein n=1 Tax=Dethiothermospora halolimnae TaxID=3114390 RepID=UPI003CCC066D